MVASGHGRRRGQVKGWRRHLAKPQARNRGSQDGFESSSVFFLFDAKHTLGMCIRLPHSHRAARIYHPLRLCSSVLSKLLELRLGLHPRPGARQANT